MRGMQPRMRLIRVLTMESRIETENNWEIGTYHQSNHSETLIIIPTMQNEYRSSFPLSSSSSFFPCNPPINGIFDRCMHNRASQ